MGEGEFVDEEEEEMMEDNRNNFITQAELFRSYA